MDAKRGDGHNFTEECREPTINLQHCMEEHRDYYQVQSCQKEVCACSAACGCRLWLYQTAAVCLLEVMVGARKCSYCSV